MLIYRVVDNNLEGYRRSTKGECLESKINNKVATPFPENYEQIRPLPAVDGIVDFPDHYIFGFQSIDLLNSWFSLDERNAGTELGGKIAIYSILSTCVLFGNKQCCFDKDKAGSPVLIKPLNFFDTKEDQNKPYPKWDE